MARLESARPTKCLERGQYGEGERWLVQEVKSILEGAEGKQAIARQNIMCNQPLRLASSLSY